MRNYPEWVVSYWATVSLGAALVGMNAWWTAPEMEYALKDSTPLVLIVDGERLDRFVRLKMLLPFI
jgi:acyl-CoA synthetase (AMP-forming)/AMP-acid ligase II